ncbi:unnamed protein product, partial [Lymnaea stagnalis]
MHGSVSTLRQVFKSSKFQNKLSYAGEVRIMLKIIFIILIVLANSFLIFKNLRKCDFMYKPKTLTILSLATGDVLMALFPMVVHTLFVFEEEDVLSLIKACRLLMTSDVYQSYLINFV